MTGVAATGRHVTSPSVAPGMEWLTSGLRRDVCILLYGEERRGQKLKSALESHYDRRVKPRQFQGAMRALVENGHVEKRVDGIADSYVLTDAGAQAVEVQYEWMHEHVQGDQLE